VDELCQTGAGVLLVTHLIYDRHRFDRVYELQEGYLHVAR
jgi:ABC-type transport system involved in cytochrome bd biosynthesis fused ATPase/permease subunit